jgi:hypothetical protein
VLRVRLESILLKKNLRGFGPLAKYADRATPLLGEVVPTFADRGCCVVSATDPPGHILGFLDRSRYYFFQVAPQQDANDLERIRKYLRV